MVSDDGKGQCTAGGILRKEIFRYTSLQEHFDRRGGDRWVKGLIVCLYRRS